MTETIEYDENLKKERETKIKEADKIIDDMNNTSEEKVEMMRVKLEKCTSSVSDISVDGSHKIHAREEALLLFAEMTTILDEGKEKLKDLYEKIDKNDRNLRIYFDKVFFKIDNKLLERKYGISKRQINRIIKKIKENS